jgi:hypothetical protein
MKFGRKRPVQTATTHPHLFKSVRKFMTGPLPTAPSVVDFFTGPKTALTDILGNDTLGDCTAAGACHLEESISFAAGSPVVLSATQAIGFYSLSTGYVVGDASTDQGGDEVTVLTTWQQKGLDGNGAHAIKGWLSVDPTDAALVASCNWLFGGLYFGIELPDTWTNPFPSADGFVWDVGTPDPNQGHCVVGVGSNSVGIQVDSWGLIGTITYAAIAQLCAESAGGNLFAVLTPEIITAAQGLAPNGLDWATLLADFDNAGGNAPSSP